jgi:hypothetical protein
MQERLLGLREGGVRRRKEERIHRPHESRRGVFRQSGTRAESGQEREGQESAARRERPRIPVSGLDGRGYAAVEPPIERSSHADGISSHSSRSEVLPVPSRQCGISDDEHADADDEKAGAAEQSAPVILRSVATKDDQPGIPNFGGEVP